MKNTISQTYKMDFDSFIRDPYMKALYDNYNDKFYEKIREHKNQRHNSTYKRCYECH